MSSLDKNRWRRLWTEIGASGDASGAFESLCKAYTVPPRAYHNMTHIADCLSEFDTAKHLAKDAHAIEFALWYHDAVYDSKAKDNEDRSAEMAAEALKPANIPSALLLKVQKLILATKHNVPAENVDTAIILDVDLSILGKPWDRFQAYERAIRDEYAWVSESDFAAGRSKILNSFLEKKRIYATDYFREKYEALARKNLRQSIKLLVG